MDSMYVKLCQVKPRGAECGNGMLQGGSFSSCLYSSLPHWIVFLSVFIY